MSVLGELKKAWSYNKDTDLAWVWAVIILVLGCAAVAELMFPGDGIRGRNRDERGMMYMEAEAVSASKPGAWGELTCTIDWCERNYVVSYYAAEFWNTLSSFLIAIASAIPIWQVYKYDLEKFLLAPAWAGVVVGIGSAGFHGALTYEMQLLDEIPMMWTIVFSLVAWAYSESRAAPPPSLWVISIIYCLFVSALHAWGGFVEEFQVHFGLLTAIAIGVVLGLANKYKSFKGIGRLAAGFPLWMAHGQFWWNLDSLICPTMHSLPFNPQGHAIWHLSCSLALYHAMCFMRAIRIIVWTGHVDVEWTLFGLIPVISEPLEYYIARNKMTQSASKSSAALKKIF